MGWGSGSSLMSNVIDALERRNIAYTTKVSVYADLINAFETFDCDTLNECVGESEAFDEAYHTYYPKED